MQRSTKSASLVAGIALAAFVTSFTAYGQAPQTQKPAAPAAPGTEKPAAQVPAAQPPAAPAATPPKPLVPVAASSVAANPDPYVGEFVTMTGAVEANLSKTSFSVDQDKTKPTAKDVLVLAPNLQKPAEANGYVTVIGQLIKFDPAEVEKSLKGYTIDLSPAD